VDQDLEPLIVETILQHRGTVTQEVERSTVSKMFLDSTHVNEVWQFGMAVIPAPEDIHAGPEMYLYIAKLTENGWVVAAEFTPEFYLLTQEAPVEIVNADQKQIYLEGISLRGNGTSQLSFPFPVGETWTFSGGPHQNSGNADFPYRRPRSAIDFARNSGSVRAAREGVVYRTSTCLNFIRIDHAGGFQTGYYHLINEAVSNGQTVNRGQHIGTASTGAGCGGSASGAHVHFTLRQNGNQIEIPGVDIGGYTVIDTTEAYDGCLRNVSTGNQICQWGTITNTGEIGSGGSGGSCAGMISYPTLVWDQTQNASICAGDQVSRWSYYFSQQRDHVFDIQRTSGNLEFNITATDANGVMLYTSDSINGRIVISDTRPSATYYLHIRSIGNTSGNVNVVIRQGITSCNNLITSSIILYDGNDCTGQMRVYNDVGYKLMTTVNFDDMASSIYIGPGRAIRVWRYMGQNPNDRNGARCLTSTTANLSQLTYDGITTLLNDTISSFDLFHATNCDNSDLGAPENGIEFYDAVSYGNTPTCVRDFTGNYVEMCAGFNDLTSSFKLRLGWSVRLFKDAQFGGTSRCFSESDADLKGNTFEDGTGVENQVSSFMLYDRPDCPAHQHIGNIDQVKRTFNVTETEFTLEICSPRINEQYPVYTYVTQPAVDGYPIKYFRYVVSHDATLAVAQYSYDFISWVDLVGVSAVVVRPNCDGTGFYGIKILNADGDGNTLANTGYYQKTAVNWYPSPSWVDADGSHSACFAHTLGYGLCDQQSRPGNNISAITISGTPSVTEGGTLNYTINASPVSPNALTVSYSVGGTAITGSDYAAPSGNIVIPANTGSVTLNISTLDDSTDELDETVIITLTGVTGGTANLGAAASTTGTIVDNDEPLSVVTISGTPSIIEGGTLDYTVQVDPVSASALTVSYAVEGEATAGEDYTAPSGTLTIPANTASVTLSIVTTHDVVDELNESVVVTLTEVTGANAVLGSSITTLGMILDDDESALSVSVGNGSVVEGNTQTQMLVFTVSLSRASEQSVSVSYITSNGTAIAGQDYQAANGTLTIPVGQTTGTITILVIGDTEMEPDEIFTLTLFNPTGGAVLGTTSATGTILDDDTEAHNLLTNGTFEAGTTSWIVNHAAGTLPNDKVVCNNVGADGSACAFLFRGGALENTRLIQNLANPPVAVNEPLYLRLAYSSKIAAPIFNVRVKVFFSDGTVRGQMVLPNTTFSRTTNTNTPNYNTVGAWLDPEMSAKPIQRIRVFVTFKSPSGRLHFDNIALLRYPVGTRTAPGSEGLLDMPQP
jgi:murein DD-endopeptidase MepM/ murein hydrolase activator NlpD